MKLGLKRTSEFCRVEKYEINLDMKKKKAHELTVCIPHDDSASQRPWPSGLLATLVIRGQYPPWVRLPVETG